ncbi:MAG: hypothetical protein L3K14_06370 [Thermoplasmata archaeon]|nr:hypothetical protein [Thermoplasmata archaeon]
MRMGLLVVGVIVAIVGAVLLFVPLVAQSNQTVSTGSTTPFVLLSVSGFSLTGSIPVGVSWTATSSVTVVAASCTAACLSSNATSISGLSGLTYQTGKSGSFTLNQPNGGEVIVGALNLGTGSPANVTFKVTTALSTVGTVLLVVGIVVLIVGVVLKSGKAKMTPAMPPMYPSTPSPGAPPPSPPMGPS